MAPRKQRSVGSLKDPATPQTPLDTRAVNTHGFPALAHEIYLEIISHIPSPSIPTPISSNSSSYPEIRRSRHEILLSLSQTCRSLRRFFWRYLWQRIEVREGIKTGDESDTLEATPYLTGNYRDKQARRSYAIELVRQLEIVTVRIPQLAQYINYVDVYFGEFSIGTVLPEFARCLSLFPNLHTVQIDITLVSGQYSEKAFERVFKKRSYPQIRNVFVTPLSQSFIVSCPEARRVGFTRDWLLSMSCLRTVVDSCPRLEVFENFPDFFWRADRCTLIVDSFPHLRTITISPCGIVAGASHQFDTLERLNHLQTITILWKPEQIHPWTRPVGFQGDYGAYLDMVKEEWIERVKGVLIEIQRRNNLEKIVVVRDDDESERRILIPPIKVKKGLEIKT